MCIKGLKPNATNRLLREAASLCIYCRVLRNRNRVDTVRKISVARSTRSIRRTYNPSVPISR